MKKYIKSKNLAVFLAIGESLSDFQRKGQLERLLDYNIKYYLKEFEKVYIFSYANEKISLPKNCILVPNKHSLHRYLYAIAMPFIEAQLTKKCATIRALQLTGGIPALICKIIFNIPYVINFGYDYEHYAKIEGKNSHAFLYKLIKRPILKNSSTVIITSQNAKSILNFVKENKLVFIPNGVDLKLFKKNKVKRTSNSSKIVFIGRLEEQKNLSNLIIACTKLKFDYQLLFFGDGKLKKSLEKLAGTLKVNLTINKPIKYFGVPRILNYADIFTLPSDIEGNPKILLEAMACECKIVASNVNGIRELIIDKENGYLSKTDPVSLADTLNKAFASKKNTGASARRFVENGYNIDMLLKKESQLLIGIK